MVDFIYVQRGYKINKKLTEDISRCQGIEGKIIEKELEPFVKNKEIQGLKLESSVGLHTLRINLGQVTGVGENDLVIHMAKESLKAFELTPPRIEDKSEKGIITKFRKNIGIEGFSNTEYDEFELDLAALEKGISAKTTESIGKIGDELKYRNIICAFPSWYYEDWVQIHFRNQELLLRIDPRCLFGIGIGKVNRSSIDYSSKDDIIFHWQGWMSNNIERYYGGGSSNCSYDNWSKAKVKVKREDRE